MNTVIRKWKIEDAADFTKTMLSADSAKPLLLLSQLMTWLSAALEFFDVTTFILEQRRQVNI